MRCDSGDLGGGRKREREIMGGDRIKVVISKKQHFLLVSY
jgi:hypothetical protein